MSVTTGALAFALSSTWLGSAVIVEGGSACPDAEQVQRELAQMIASDAQIGEHARVIERAQSFVVELTDTDGTILVHREVAAVGSCADRARVAAVILAARLGDKHPELVTDVPARPTPAVLPPVKPPTAPVITARASPSARVSIADMNLRHIDVGAGVAASLADAQSNLAIAVSGSFLPGGWPGEFSGVRGLGIFAGASIDGTRRLAVASPGPGQVTWRRIPLALGPAYRKAFSRFSVDGRAVALMAPTSIVGQGFGTNQRHQPVSIGAGLGARVSTRGAAVTSWADLSANVWARQVVYSDGSGASEAALPTLSIMLAIGASLCPRCEAPP